MVKILVTGVSGQQGGATARVLLAQGQTFRGLSRTPDQLGWFRQQGVEVVRGNLTDGESLQRALQGIESVFLVTTWIEEDCEAEVEQGKVFIDAAKAAGVKHIVYTSVAAADEATGIPHFESKMRVEEYLYQSGVPWTVVRPALFMENFAAPWLSIQEGSVAMSVHPDTVVCMVSIETIGQFGAAALLHPEVYLQKALPLMSDSLTFPQALKLLSKAIGRNVGYKELPEEEAVGIYGADLAKMFRWFNEQGFTDTVAELRSYGLPMPALEEHLKSASWLEKFRIKAASESAV